MYSLTTCTHITRHYRQWSPHSLTHLPFNHVPNTHTLNKQSRTQQILAARSPHTHVPAAHSHTNHKSMSSTRTHHALTNPPRDQSLTVTVTHSLYYHTHYALTTQLLTGNHHSLIIFSPCTHLPSLFHHTITYSSRHTLTPHAITHRPRTHTLNMQSYASQTLTH